MKPFRIQSRFCRPPSTYRFTPPPLCGIPTSFPDPASVSAAAVTQSHRPGHRSPLLPGPVVSSPAVRRLPAPPPQSLPSLSPFSPLLSPACALHNTAGLALMVLPTLIVGNELLILGGVAVLVGCWFLAHRHGHLHGLLSEKQSSPVKNQKSKIKIPQSPSNPPIQ
jgi:hypothetical protein